MNNIGVYGGYCYCKSLSELHTHSYQGTVRGPDAGLRAGPAACVESSYSATAVNPVSRRTAGGHTPAPHG